MARQRDQAAGRGCRLTDDTLLHRQVHPSFVQQGRVTSQAFRPTPKDRKKLSVYDGDLITAAKAWEHFTMVLGFASAGVLAVSYAECRSLALLVTPDPTPFPEHAVIDFSGIEEKQVTAVSKRLRAMAEARGWQYQATAD